MSRATASTSLPISHSCYNSLVGLLNKDELPDLDRIASISFEQVDKANYEDLQSNVARLSAELKQQSLNFSTAQGGAIRVDFYFEEELGKEWVSGPVNSQTGLRQASNRVSNDSSSLDYILKTFAFHPEREVVEEGRNGWLNKVRVRVYISNRSQLEGLEDALLDEDYYRMRSYRFADRIEMQSLSPKELIDAEEAKLLTLKDEKEKLALQLELSSDSEDPGDTYRLREALLLVNRSIEQQEAKIVRLIHQLDQSDF